MLIRLCALFIIGITVVSFMPYMFIELLDQGLQLRAVLSTELLMLMIVFLIYRVIDHEMNRTAVTN